MGNISFPHSFSTSMWMTKCFLLTFVTILWIYLIMLPIFCVLQVKKILLYLIVNFTMMPAVISLKMATFWLFLFLVTEDFQMTLYWESSLSCLNPWGSVSLLKALVGIHAIKLCNSFLLSEKIFQLKVLSVRNMV